MQASQPGSTPGASDEQSATAERDAGWADEKLKPILESLLFAAGEPVSLTQLANALEEVPRERIRKTLSEMAAGYAGSRRGVLLEEIAGGYQLRTPSEHAVYVRRLLSAKPPRLSRPVLETLAIVAYRQPITRPEIEQLRGVDSGGVLDTLVERDLIKIAGRKDAPGRPIVYMTTPGFLELFGLKDLESLPDLEEFRELQDAYEPAGAAQTTLLVDSTEAVVSESPHETEAPEQPVLNEPAGDSPITQADEISGEASASGAAREDTSSSAEADKSAKSAMMAAQKTQPSR
ncbi:MAG: SMC-Scp complex subunit ScpB [Deltaproteobacteria bacterium]|nr:SMC-Scp complex subunit ScpB [Deltaproteobacteria bacterium]MBV8452006.1 SMC-Scp complex subunit ScpB [Deltaproteobacteria bacterium]